MSSNGSESSKVEISRADRIGGWVECIPENTIAAPPLVSSIKAVWGSLAAVFCKMLSNSMGGAGSLFALL